MLAEGHAPGTAEGAGLDEEDLLAAGVDAEAETGHLAVPEDGVLAHWRGDCRRYAWRGCDTGVATWCPAPEKRAFGHGGARVMKTTMRAPRSGGLRPEICLRHRPLRHGLGDPVSTDASCCGTGRFSRKRTENAGARTRLVSGPCRGTFGDGGYHPASLAVRNSRVKTTTYATDAPTGTACHRCLKGGLWGDLFTRHQCHSLRPV